MSEIELNPTESERYGIRFNGVAWEIFEKFIGGTEWIITSYKSEAKARKQFDKLLFGISRGILKKEQQLDYLQMAINDASDYLRSLEP